MNVLTVLQKNNLSPNPLKDQFFLIDDEILTHIVNLAELSSEDVVLEVGAGIGNLTDKLSEKAGRVISFEIDDRFKPILDKLPKNVEMHYENAWNYVQLHGKFRKRKEYNKIVSNLPYSFSEQFLHNLTFLEYDKAILLIPVSLSKKINSHHIFSSFFQSIELIKVPSSKFFPGPNTGSVVIELKKLPDAIKTKDLPRFLRQYVYQREEQKVKNSLREGLIDFYKLALDLPLTKREAIEIIQKSGITARLLEVLPSGPKIYEEISEKVSVWNNNKIKNMNQNNIVFESQGFSTNFF